MTAVPRLVLADRGYWVVDAATLPFQALVVLRPVDVHGAAVRGVVATCDRPGTRARTTREGAVVVSGDASLVFPDLGVAPDVVTVGLRVPGRPAWTETVAIPQNAVLPVDAGPVAAPPLAVSVAGQVRRRDLAQAPLGNALVRFVTNAGVPGLHPVALRTALQTPHPAGSTVRRAGVAAAAAPTTCPDGVRAGAHVLGVASTAGIVAGTVLRFTPGRGEHFGVVREVVDGEVVLEAPLAATVPPGGEVRAVTATPAGPTRTLTRAAAAGDALLALNAELTGGVAVRVVDGVTGLAEVYAVGARTNAAGFYRLGRVRGVPAVAVHATATGLAATQPATVWRVDEHVDPNPLDLAVQP